MAVRTVPGQSRYRSASYLPISSTSATVKRSSTMKARSWAAARKPGPMPLWSQANSSGMRDGSSGVAPNGGCGSWMRGAQKSVLSGSWPRTTARTDQRRSGAASGLCVSERQEPLEGLADPAVALTRRSFETGTIRHGDGASALRDKPFCLKRPHDGAHGRALDPQHRGENLMAERQRILTNTVMGAEQPTATALFHTMDGVTSHVLKNAGRDGF